MIEFHSVYPALNKPLTILGVERRPFFGLLILAAALFTFFNALVPALALFLVFLVLLRAATQIDPQILRVLINSSRFAVRYDPAKWSPSGTERGEQKR
jgi:type IV secretory pathway VirB3-like protein